MTHDQAIKLISLCGSGDLCNTFFASLEEPQAISPPNIAMGRKGIIPEHRVKEQVDELEKTLTLEKFRLSEMHGEELDINALLAYAYDFIRTVENVWCDAIPEVKVSLQRFIFPKGVNYDSTGFSNSRICPLFKQISLVGSEIPSMVTPRGIEPRLPG